MTQTSLTSSKASGRPRASARRRFARWRGQLTFDRISFMVVFLGLPLAIFVVFVLVPVVEALFYSLTNWTGFSDTYDVVGFDNFTKLAHDDIFVHAVRNNIELAVVVPILTLTVAFAIAVVVTMGGPSTGPVRGIHGGGFYRIVSFFPYVVPAIVIGLIWGQVFDPSSGLANGILTKIGLHRFTDFAWLGEVKSAMPASMFVIIWASIGFYTVLFVAAIKGLPAEIYEAAKLDGASRLRTAVSITLPLIRDAVQTAYIYIGILCLDAFVFMQALNFNGGPENSTLTMSQYLYVTAFRKGQYGYATAMGVVLALLTLLFALIVFAVFRLLSGRPEKGRA